MMSGDQTGAEAAFSEAADGARRAGNIHLAVPAMGALAHQRVQNGQLVEATAIYREAALVGSDPDGKPLPLAAEASSASAARLF